MYSLGRLKDFVGTLCLELEEEIPNKRLMRFFGQQEGTWAWIGVKGPVGPVYQIWALRLMGSLFIGAAILLAMIFLGVIETA